MNKKYLMKIMGDYNNEIYFDNIEDLYNPQNIMEEVPPLKYSKFLDTINMSVLILKKYGEDFLIIKPEGPQLKYNHDPKELCGRIYSKVYPIYHEVGFSDILKEVDETNEDGEEEEPQEEEPPEEDNPDGVPKFKPENFTWTTYDGNPRNYVQVLKRLKMYPVKVVKERIIFQRQIKKILLFTEAKKYVKI